MSSSQPLSSNPEAQNAASQQFHEKPIPSQTNGTFQPPQAVRQRHQQGNASHGVSQRDHNYNSPIGGYRNSSSDDTATYRSHRSHDPHHFKRRQIRHRLHQKHKQDGPVPVRLKWTKFMHSDTKNHAVAFMGEFVGTFMFLFFAFAGTQVANIGVGDSTDQVGMLSPNSYKTWNCNPSDTIRSDPRPAPQLVSTQQLYFISPLVSVSV